MKLTIIAGARPNFIKIAPLIHAIEKNNIDNETPIEYRLVHTGQHYDKLMSELFVSDERDVLKTQKSKKQGLII